MELRIKEFFIFICHILEYILASFVLIAVIIATISLIPSLKDCVIVSFSGDYVIFNHFLEQVFAIVIGVEFLKMLCRPNSDNILETIIFLVARHMIMAGDTTPIDYLVSTVCIVILCFVRRYLKDNRKIGFSLKTDKFEEEQ
ncbi:MAG: hypothetical protein HUJ71_05220 [Pseudobutyrivibrio sp.]|nr:hypothetical protein [Pseudobutyrivibrio sp.]